MKQLTIGKVINSALILAGLVFVVFGLLEAWQGFSFLGQNETSGLLQMATVVPFAIKEEISQKSGKKFLVATFDKAYWMGLSLVKKAILRANFLQSFNGAGGYWLIQPMPSLERAEATLNSLTLDRRETVEELNEVEGAMYARLKEKADSKGQPKASKAKQGDFRAAQIAAIGQLKISDKEKLAAILSLK